MFIVINVIMTIRDGPLSVSSKVEVLHWCMKCKFAYRSVYSRSVFKKRREKKLVRKSDEQFISLCCFTFHAQCRSADESCHTYE